MHLNFEPNALCAPEIKFDDFLKIDIRLGEITEVRDFPEARNPSYKLSIDFGPGVGIKKSSAQLTAHYTKECLHGKNVLAVVNFPPRQIGPFISEVLVLGLSDNEGGIVLFDLDKAVPKGARLH